MLSPLLPLASAGSFSVVKSSVFSTRLVSGFGGGPPAIKASPVAYSAFRPGLPSSVVSQAAGTGSPSSRRKRVPGTNRIVADGNSAFKPSRKLTVCVGLPL